MSDLFIGIDIGTGSTKGVLADDSGTTIATAVRKHETSFPRPGYAEHDADEIWWSDFVEVCTELVARAKGKVAGLCISGIGPDFLPTDEKGAPLRSAILYGVDTRSADEIAEITDRLGYDKILKVCGNDLTTQSVGPKIEWYRKHQPDLWKKTKRFFMAHTYCIFHLTGAYVLDHLAASMCDPLYSPFTRDWVGEWVDDIAPGLPMPELRWSNEIAGYITENASRVTGLAPGTPVAVGSVDAFVEAFSVGVCKPGQVMIMYGSTMVGVAISEAPLIGPNLWSCSGLFEGTYNLSGGMSTTGSLTTWVSDLTGADYDQLSAEAEKSPVGSNGLVTLPYFSGERSPIADPAARGLVCGLSLSHTRGDLYRSMLEATGYGSRHLFEAVKNAGGQLDTYVAVGGGTTGGLWPQIMSDAIDIEQDIPETTIGAAYGDCLLAAMAAGKCSVDTVWNRSVRTVKPNPETRERYDQLYAIYRGLYPATSEYMHELAAIQE
jgi:Sugar (pentulose and hexulose) kinases